MLSCLLRIDMIIIALLCACLLTLCLPQPCLASDTLKIGESLTDGGSNNLVSIGGKFELGFFSPSESRERYLGIWYHSLKPKTAWDYRSSRPQVVWVANRDNPVLDSTGIFQFSEDGNLIVIDTKGTRYWTSGLEEVSSLTNWTVNLMDSGNLILRDDQLKVIWQSFEHPTDTFLVDMKMDKNLVLTSWRAPDDPRSGDFTIKMGNTGDDVYRIYKNRSQLHWEGETLVDFGPGGSIILSLLTNFTATPKTLEIKNFSKSFSAVPSRSDYEYIRLVMNSTGVIQLLIWDKLTGWFPKWIHSSVAEGESVLCLWRSVLEKYNIMRGKQDNIHKLENDESEKP